MFMPGYYNSSEQYDESSKPVGDDAFYNLLPALLQCFAIIVFGYLSGRIGLVSQGQGKGLAVFVSKFAMPAMLFKSMCELHFASVNWKFLAAVLLTKVTVFMTVILVTALLIRPTNLGKMGIYGIFSTQSHDFALGIPIVQALYSSTHPEYENYLYLIAPISVAFLNPIGFSMMAAQNWKNSFPQTRKSKARAVMEVLLEVLKNPIVSMTILGIVCNFIFHQKVPTYLDDILIVLKNAFPATALFCLGHSMVGKITNQKDRSFIILFLLIAAKMVMSPLLIRELVSVLNSGINQTELADLSGFGFLYGMFPTAPTVFIYAAYYNTEPDMMATGMVVSTFVAAPLMFVSGKMLMMPVSDKENWLPLVHRTSFDVGIISLCSVIWVLVVFYINRRIHNLPHQFTAFLGISQVIMSIGMILLETISGSAMWQHCLQFILFYTGLLSTRCWMAMIAFSLCVLRVRSFCALYSLRPYIFFYAIGIPIIVSGVLLASTPQSRLANLDPSYLNGFTQRVVMLCALSLNILMAVLALIRSHRYQITHLIASRSETSVESSDSEVVYANTPALLINGTSSFLTPGPNNRYTSPVTICRSAPSKFACYNPKNGRTRIPSPMLNAIPQQHGDEDEWNKLRDDSDEEPALQERRRRRKDSEEYHKLALENTMRKRQDTVDLAKLVEHWGMDAGSRQDTDDTYLKPGNPHLRPGEDGDRRGMGRRKDSEDIIGRGMRDSRDNSEIDFLRLQQQEEIEEEPEEYTEKEDLRAKRLRRRAAQKEAEQEEEVQDKKFYIGNKPIIETSEKGMESKRKRRRAGQEEEQRQEEVKPVITVDIEDLGDDAVVQIEARKRHKRGTPNAENACGTQPSCSNCVDCEGTNTVRNLQDLAAASIPQHQLSSEATETTPLLLGNGTLPTVANEQCPAAGTTLCDGQANCVIAQNLQRADVSSEDELLMIQDQDLIEHSRHMLLVLLLLVSAFVSFCLNVWTLMNEKVSSVYVEVEFLDSVLTYGQGFFIFAVFGVDTQLIVEPIVKKWREWWTGRQELVLPAWDDLDETSQRTCEQFVRYHLQQCQEIIVSDRRERLRLYRDVFLGTHLVDWLIEVGLAADRPDAVCYGQRLLQGRVLEHIMRKHNFQDLPYFYHFTEESHNRVYYDEMP